jgi:ABC-type sulfate transport system permease subunit
VRYTLIAVALLFLTLFLFVPLVAVFVEALKQGWDHLHGRRHRPGRAGGRSS